MEKNVNLVSVGLSALAAIEAHGSLVVDIDALKALFNIAVDAIASYNDATAAERAIAEAVEPAVEAKPAASVIADIAKGVSATPKTIATQRFSIQTGRETSMVSEKEKRLIVSLIKKGWDDDVVAVELARPASTVANVRRAAGLTPRNGAPAPRRTRKRRGPTTASAVRCLFELYLRDYSLGRAAETADLSDVVARNLLDEAGILRDRTESARARVRFEAYCNGKLPAPSKERAAQKAAELVDEMLRRRRGA